jgi:uncharacterized membrane protein YbhN (UPF0104 family)
MNPRWRLGLRVVGSIGILLVLLVVLPSGSLQAAFAQASLPVFIVAFTIHFLAHLVAALKWRMLMGSDGDVSVTKAFKAHFSGLVGNLSPFGMIGGDIVRAGVAISGSTRPAAIMVTSIVDRVVDTASLLILTLIGFLWIGRASTETSVVLWGAGVLFATALAVAFLLLTWLRRTKNDRFAAIRDASHVILRQPGLIARSLVLSMGIQVAFIAANAYLGRDVGVECSFGAWLVAWPASKLAGYLPIAIAGIGIRESALIVLLGPLGGTPGPVMAASLLWQGVFIGGALLGWLVWSVIPGFALALRRPQAR